MNINLRGLLALSGLFVLLASPTAAQVPVEYPPGSSVVSREGLEDLLRQYESAANSPAYSGRIRETARQAAERIRLRLEEGDFRVGDRIVLEVQGERNLPDTVPVEPGPQITLPLMGAISLDGVLRSEITAHLTGEIGRFIRDPVVRAQGLMRLSIQGAVGAPGFYVVPTDMLLSEAVMVAGGPAPDADLEDLRVERGADRLLGQEESQAALRDGRTLDQLNLRAGDQIVLPREQRGRGIWGSVGRFALVVGSALLLGVRVF
jgi:polysaccharide export outer membrane protein